jgi:hypothetical protein
MRRATAREIRFRFAAEALPGFGSRAFVERDLEGEREPDGHLRRQAQPIVLIVGHEGLQDADFFGELGLGETALAAEASQTLADGFAAVIQRRQIQTRRTRHPRTVSHATLRVKKCLRKFLTRFLAEFSEQRFLPKPETGRF